MKPKVKNDADKVLKENIERETIIFKSNIRGLENMYGIKILLAYVRGSHMYGTANDKSDVDITFVYQQPTDEILKGNYKEQITMSKSDVVGYEIQRFLQLLSQNNPNILEALDIPDDCLIYMDESIKPILNQDLWLSKLTKNTILGYAQSQIKKATGLEKMMNNPVKERKDIVDFCYLIFNGKSIALKEWAKRRGINLGRVGLVKIPNGKGLYGMYVDRDNTQKFRGIIKDSEHTQLRLSSIPEDYAAANFADTLWYNQDGFESHIKQYNSYKQWESERNPERYKDNQKAGQGVDLKNMSHLHRLLEMALKISEGKGFRVRAENVSLLREIREGKYSYDSLMQKSEKLTQKILENFKTVELQDRPDTEMVKEIILNFRKNN